MLSPSESQKLATQTRIALKMADDVIFTCEDCQDNDNCEYAFDPYNTHGDCLAIK